MSSIPVPNGVRVEMIYTIAAQRVQNVYHVTKGSPASAADLLQIWTVFRDWENVDMKATRYNGCSLVLIVCTALDGPGAPVLEQQVNPVITGTGGAGIVSSMVTLAVKHTTGKAGRSFRGRTYQVGLHSGWMTTPDSTSVTNAASLGNLYTLLRTKLATAGWTFCIASLYSGVTIINGRRRAIPRASGILTPVTASQCEVGFDTQRHRKAPYQV